jgi:uncharacterized protein YkwD
MVVVLVLLLSSCAQARPVDRAQRAVPAAAGDRTPASPIAGDIFRLTNAERARARVRILRLDRKLTEAARWHANQLASAGRLAHVIPGARFPRLEDRLEAADYEWRAVAENLASGDSRAGAVVAR